MGQRKEKKNFLLNFVSIVQWVVRIIIINLTKEKERDRFHIYIYIDVDTDTDV